MSSSTRRESRFWRPTEVKSRSVEQSAHSAGAAPAKFLFNATDASLTRQLVITTASSIPPSPGQLFVVNLGSGIVGEYTTSGAAINPSLISGLSNPGPLALDTNGFLYVGNYAGRTVGQYTTTGAAV